MVKVLQIGMTRNHGGLETYLLQQWRHLDAHKVHYDFVNITGEYTIVGQKEIEQSGSRIYSVCSRHLHPLRHYWQWFKLLQQHAKEYKAIVLNTNSLEYIYPLFLAKWFHIPMRIIHSHNAGFENQMGLGRRLLVRFNRMLMKRSATDYFACSKQAGRWMFGLQQTYHVIHNAIDVEEVRYKSEVRQKKRNELGLGNKFILGHIGRFSYQKNHEFLIDIFAKVYERDNSAALLLVGGAVGDDRFLQKAKQQVKKLGLEQAVFFLGERDDVPELLQAMDCFLLPSRFEGLGLVGIESQAAGLPTFISDTITQEIKITDSAYFLPLDQPELWAEAILKHKKDSRKDTQKEVRKSGYDICYEVKKIEKYYLC